MEETREGPQRKINRVLFLVVIVLSVLGVRYIARPIAPHILLPAENLTKYPLFMSQRFGDFYFTNTLLATLLADIILILIALSIRRATRGGDLVLSGLAGAVSGILEALYGLTESTAGKWARRIFPFFATIFLLVLVVNWMELIPGVDSIGWFDSHHLHHPEDCEFLPSLETASPIRALTGGEADAECSSGIIPWVRVASTDLNFTIALALVSVVMTQVIGWQALKGEYFTKYINVRPFMRSVGKARFGNPMDFMLGIIDFAVGILEIIAEIAKIISFSFRLFGNIFAGSVLLFVIGSLVPVFAQSLFLLLELFVGFIQATVFGMLTMVFMAQATQGHGGHEGEAH